PTYMHAVVVDDHDMGITDVIRGDDHLTNTFRQLQIYQAMSWEAPSFAHIPMILGPDGAKLSKRHGALGVEAYRDMGYLPEAMRNYLLRLGWGHGDDEIISTEQAIAWFDLDGVGRSPSRFDFAKLDNLNGHYLRQSADARLAKQVVERLGVAGDEAIEQRLAAGMPGLKARAKTLKELADNARFYTLKRPLPVDDKARALLTPDASNVLKELRSILAAAPMWISADLEAEARRFAEMKAIKLGQVAQPLRAALTGSTTSPPVFEVMQVLGREETLGRIDDTTSAKG
ncbi:MAG TPA: glutamate--tRNA ligase family protein, partial [Dongiaceae bacterium]